MPRTALLRSIVRLAEDHAAAERAGTDPASIRARRAETSLADRPLRRREFLAGAAAAGAALGLGAVVPRSARAASGTPRIAIVGGGIAGLTAALSLADKGIASTVYESSDRVGGRMHTDASGYWADGQLTEWGGELIDTGHKTVQFLAQRFKLPLDDLFGAEPNGSEDTYYFSGGYYTKRQADIDFQPVHQALQRDVWAASYPTTWETKTAGGIELDRMSIHDWIESRVPGGHAAPLGMLLDVAYDIEFGAPTTDQSSLNLVYLLGYNASPGNVAIFGGSDERYRIRGGNEQLPRRIADALEGARPGSILTGWRMTAITRTADAVTMQFDTPAGGRQVSADHVILSLPFAVLAGLDYRRAGFDDRKKLAITTLGRGHNGKLQLQFRERFWNSSGPWPGISNGATYADTGYQNTWDVSRAQAGRSGILVDYTGGLVTDRIRAQSPRSTADSRDVAAAARRFLDQIEPVLPGLSSGWSGRATLSLPHLDPNFNCSYSYWRVGQYTTIAGYEGAPQGRIHFAGEHSSVDFQGWMEGGAITGVRAANGVLAGLR